MLKITCISRTLKYPVDESVYAGIPLSIRASANVSAQPVTDLVRITISLYSAGLYTFSSASYTFTPEETIPSISFASLSASSSLVVASSSFSEDIRITSVLLLISSP